jgi:hypothetical protein
VVFELVREEEWWLWFVVVVEWVVRKVSYGGGDGGERLLGREN